MGFNAQSPGHLGMAGQDGAQPTGAQRESHGRPEPVVKGPLAIR